MKQDLKVLCRWECPACGGAGKKPHPLWAQVAPDWDQEKIKAFFSERGYKKVPSRELPCGKCQGEGWEYGWKDPRELSGSPAERRYHEED